MKKVFFILGILSVCALGFIACSDEEDNGCPGGGTFVDTANSDSACQSAAFLKYGSSAYYCFGEKKNSKGESSGEKCYIYASDPN